MNPAAGEMDRPGRVHLVSLGCPKNWVDSEVMLGYLTRAGYVPFPEPSEADLIVVNTCAFIREAKEEALETILELAQWKGEGSCRRLVVVGCLPQRYGEELLDLLPEVDLFLGTGEIPRIVDRLRALEQGSDRACHLLPATYLFGEVDPRVRATPGGTAYVRIAEGCSNRCAYCAVPDIRGSLRSRTVESVVREVNRLAAEGVVEVNLIAQDTTAFGLDRGRESELPDLVATLDRVNGVEWIRLLYAHPAHLTEEMVRVMAQATHLCPYLDLPIQHIAPRILRAMNRRVGPEEIRDRVRMLREYIPGLHLRTSLIVGFPGETEEEFRELLDFVREVRFEWMGAFVYSREEGTPAADMKPPVKKAVARRRLRSLMEAQRGITRDAMERWVGHVVPVLVEREIEDSPGHAMGRAAFQAPEIDGVVFLRGRGISPGRIQPVRITGARDYDLEGEAVSSG
jgi:ribosomal protein S12 methylthiotransferase